MYHIHSFQLIIKGNAIQAVSKKNSSDIKEWFDNRYSNKLVTLLESNPNINTFNEALSLDQRLIKVMQFILKVPPAKSGSTDILIQIVTT